MPSSSDFLIGDHFSISWQRTHGQTIDVFQFEEALTRATRAKNQEDVVLEVEELQRAVHLYVDDLMPLLYDSWIVPVRQELRDRLSGALYRLASLRQQQDHLQEAITTAEKLVAHDSLRESNYRLLMGLHKANQDRASSLRTYHQLKTALRRDLGISPSPETMTLLEEVLKGVHQALKTRTLPDSERFDVRRMVGRVQELQHLESAWTKVIRGDTQAIIIAGEPGIGKTRLADEFIHRAKSNGHAIARARCYSGRGQIAYAPVAEWLRSATLQTALPKIFFFANLSVGQACT